MLARQGVFVGVVVTALTLPVGAWSQERIACGETKTASYDYGHHGLAIFTFHAEAGKKYSFLTESGNSNVVIFVGRPPSLSQGPVINGPRAWLCDWTAWDTGDFQVILDISASDGWRVSLTVFCSDSSPTECTEVSATPTTWARVKDLFR